MTAVAAGTVVTVVAASWLDRRRTRRGTSYAAAYADGYRDGSADRRR